ncbi:M23 family metallopeptidase [Metabacillus arenae]|uniref:Peptidoglycan DD-metalloendopeptidase family protein n=1 Tax=Metabacillus arenae TaxID=2771434 RepID=A0A926NBV2_9BACI|nr:M23 family metallopeptidase [Metabacillus arenae]MBD1378654.1 peptidoglycan DD-metalloendopeptidase family protein [Metabacillus arenae]
MINHIKNFAVVVLLIFCMTFIFSGVMAKGQENGYPANWEVPVKGTITDTYGSREGHHKGIDIAAEAGSAILSVNEGVVTKSYYSKTYGHVVFVKHPDGFETVYAHLNKRLAEKGKKVSKGEKLGIIGNTGVSRGTHLHFEVHQGKWNIEKSESINPFLLVAAEQIESPGVASSSRIKEEDNSNLSTIEEQEPNKEVSKAVKTIIVEKGDTLWNISQEQKIEVAVLKDWNDLTSTLIFPGQELAVYQ